MTVTNHIAELVHSLVKMALRAIAPCVLLWIGALIRAQAGDVTLAWDAVPQPDIDHYTVTYGEYGQAATQNVNVTATQAALSLPDGKYYQASVTATNTSGATSLPSAVFVFQANAASGVVTPTAPTGLRRGDITLTLQTSPDLRQWTDIGYVLVPAATAPNQAYYRLTIGKAP